MSFLEPYKSLVFKSTVLEYYTHTYTLSVSLFHPPLRSTRHFTVLSVLRHLVLFVYPKWTPHYPSPHIRPINVLTSVEPPSDDTDSHLYLSGHSSSRHIRAVLYYHQIWTHHHLHHRLHLYYAKRPWPTIVTPSIFLIPFENPESGVPRKLYWLSVPFSCNFFVNS